MPSKTQSIAIVGLFSYFRVSVSLVLSQDNLASSILHDFFQSKSDASALRDGFAHWSNRRTAQHDLKEIGKSVGELLSPGMSLSRFRDEVVHRPTPPLDIKIPQLEAMRSPLFQGAVGQAMQCATFAHMLRHTGPAVGAGAVEGPKLQEPMYINEAHKLAIEAMKRYPEDPFTQAWCGGFMGDMVQWNWVLAHAVAKEGALEVMVKALKLPDEEVWHLIPQALGAFFDQDRGNRQEAARLGLLDHAYERKEHTEDSAVSLYCLWSTLCMEPDLAKEMVDQYGELERGVKMMEMFTGKVRGEIIQVHQACYVSQNPAWAIKSWDAGMAPMVLKTMRDEISGKFGELDPLSPQRLLSNGMAMLRAFAGLGETYRQTLRSSGALEQVTAVLNDRAPGLRTIHPGTELTHDLDSEAQATLAAIRQP